MPRTARMAPGGIIHHVVNKSFAMQNDEHLSTVDRYVARNALRANLAERAELWPWSSIGQSLLPAALQVPLSEMSAGAQNQPPLSALKPATLSEGIFEELNRDSRTFF